MRHPFLPSLLAILFLLTGTSAVYATPSDVATRIESVGLFKNGLAVVRRTLTAPGPGVFTVTDIPQPVHGTFWVESSASVTTRATTRTVTTPGDDRPTGIVGQDLAGSRVTIMFRDGRIPPVTGTIVDAASTTAEARLILDTATDRVYLDPGLIAYLTVVEPAPRAPTVVSREEAVLEFDVKGATTFPAEVTITYLTFGLSWMPSYRVDSSDASVLTVTQQAVLKNELIDLEGVDVELISGFPAVEFGHVTSPLVRQQQMTSFFTQLGQATAGRHGRSRGNVAMQQAVMMNYAVPNGGGSGDEAAIIPTGEGVDMHYHAIGPHTLAKGDALMLTVAEQRTPYERIIEWSIPDTRDAWGRMVEDWQRQQDPDRYDAAAWDALRFTNPFDFPMTTAPAMITDGPRFSGQRTSSWVNPGERTTLRITKALSVRTHAVENEEPGEREIIRFGGRNFRQPRVAGEVLVCNHRAEPVTVLVRRAFSGDLIEAEGNPETSLRESGTYSVNQRRELVWTLVLEPGETRTLTYRYSVLVHH